VLSLLIMFWVVAKWEDRKGKSVQILGSNIKHWSRNVKRIQASDYYKLLSYTIGTNSVNDLDSAELFNLGAGTCDWEVLA